MKTLATTLMIGAATFALSTNVMAQTAIEAQTNTKVQTQAESQAQIQPSSGGMNTTADKRMEQLNDDSRVVITGTVAEIDGDEFQLNYGGNKTITVEMDRFGFEGDETKYLTVGESVTVSGFIDDDLFEGREIEALDVRLNDSYVYYYYDQPNLSQNYGSYNQQSSEDMASSNEQLQDGSYFSMTGEVMALNGAVATVKGTTQTIDVDMSELGYDPTDDEGLQKIEVGDRVFAYGEIDDGFFTSKKLVATGTVELQKRTNASAGAKVKPQSTM